MGTHCSSCHFSKAKKDANQNAIQKTNPNLVQNHNYSRQGADQETTISTQEFHAQQRDFIRKQSYDFKSNYYMKEEIGSGGFGKVRKAIDRRSGQTRAVKILNKTNLVPKMTKEMMKEVQLMINLDHPNILKVYEVFEDERKFYIVSEILSGGELFERIIENKNLTEQDTAKIMKQVLSAVAYCHHLGIAHRDLKPENILFDSKSGDVIKIIDFGLSQNFKPLSTMTGIKGTCYYMAPEVLKGSYTEKCDVWSCGVILYVMLSGYPPFNGRTDEQILQSVLRGQYDFNDPVWKSVSDGAKNFIRRMLTYDPKKRCTAEQALADPWFNQFKERSSVDQALAQEALQRLKSYRTTTKIQEAVWVFLVTYFSSKEDNKHLWDLFQSLDLNHDGQLTKQEIISGYVKIMGMSEDMAEAEAERIFNTLDMNHDQRIDYSDFVNAATNRKILLTKEKLESAFKVFDRDGDGRITADELKHMFNNEKIKSFPPGFWESWIAQVDKNKDGVISLDEFKEMMISLAANDMEMSKRKNNQQKML